MPAIQITIDSEAFTIPAPYAEGSVLKPNEAIALNTAFCNAVRNHFAQHVKKSKAEGRFDRTAFQLNINDFCKGFDFSRQRALKRPRVDPIIKEARELALIKVKEAVDANGYKVDRKTLAALAEQHFQKNEKSLLEMAQIRLQTLSKIASAEIVQP